MVANSKVSGCIDILIEYKKGGYTLDQAVDRFKKLSGMREDVAREYIRSMSRDNVISLNTKREALEKNNEPDIAG